MIYFDNAATRTPSLGLIRAFESYKTTYFNPSSHHTVGMSARKLLDSVREELLAYVPLKAEVLFTSGATEANNMVLRTYFEKGKHMITSVYEHPSVRSVIDHFEREGMEVTRLKDVRVEAVLDAVKENTTLVSIMHVNNELGLRFELDGLYEKLKERKIALHRDSVQSFFKYDLKKATYLTASGHKMGALKGIGILFKEKGSPLKPLLLGGEQESGLRSGTENVLGILSIKEALKEPENLTKVSAIHEYISDHLPKDTLVLTPEDGSKFILAIAIKDVPSEIVMSDLSAKEIYVSAGSACSSRSEHVSHSAAELNLPKEYLGGVLRLSFSSFNTLQEAEIFTEELERSVSMIRKVIK
ncbi:cysteine desulfurase family protein [Guggenheimella bovis]